MVPSKWPRDLRVVLPILVVALAVRICQIGWGLPFVFEEAIPLKKAWLMWGWGMHVGVDLNPRFFNYPSLAIYLHFVAQGALFVVMKIAGLVASGADYHARYIVDPTPFYYVGRSMSVLFGVGTVWLAYRVGQWFAGRRVAIATAVLIAVNTFHISRSHLVDVDLPLTFFVMLALWRLLRLRAEPTLKNYILTGVAIGLATSTKYTGAMLVLPFIAAEFIIRATARRKPRVWYPLLTILLAALVFVSTSPFVVLDRSTFAEHFALERQHMRLGHFGLSGSSSWMFYGRVLAENLLGWPGAVLALAGFVYFVMVRRQWSVVIFAAFVVPYLYGVSTWSMHADRYLLPVLPVLTLFAATMIDRSLSVPPASRLSDRVRTVAAGVLALLVATPVVADYPAYLRSIRSDTRATATRWIEKHVPSSSYLVVEPHGPELFGPQKLAQLSTDVRTKVLELKKGTPNYAVLPVPMFQVAPERSEVFYDHSLYENADYIVTTGAVRSRYTEEPARFPRQVAFYDGLETGYDRSAEFRPSGGGGSLITVYKNRLHDTPFGRREGVAPPRLLGRGRYAATGSEELYYFSVGLNYEVFLFLEGAIAAYDMAFLFPIDRPSAFNNLVLRKTHCLLLMKRSSEAVQYLDTMIPKAPTREVRQTLKSLRDVIGKGEKPTDP